MAGDKRPSLIVVTDQDAAKIARAQAIFGPVAKERKIDLRVINTKGAHNEWQLLADETGGELFDDIMVMVAFPSVLELGESLLAFNGCLNFFAGPLNQDFYAKLNYYDVHYMEKHVIGTTGGNTDDQREALALMEKRLIHPEALITHVGGLDASLGATLSLPSIPGGKKLIYTHKKSPLFALDDLPALASESSFYAGLAAIVADRGGLWSRKAEDYFLANAGEIKGDSAVKEMQK
jgi:threonine dehydrogenase-like Zn-dependent dehydrogenase